MQLTHTLRFSVRLPTHIICWTLFFSGSKKFIYALMFCGESDPAAATSWHFEWMRRSHSEPHPLCLLLLVSFTFPKIILSFCLKRMRTEDEEEEKEKEEDREEEEWWRESGGGRLWIEEQERKNSDWHFQQWWNVRSFTKTCGYLFLKRLLVHFSISIVEGCRGAEDENPWNLFHLKMNRLVK